MFEYIQNSTGRIFQKGFYFDQSNLKPDEQLIVSEVQLNSEPAVQLYVSRSLKIQNTKKITFEETFACGFKDRLKISSDGEYIGHFYFNMTGYNSSFSLYHPDGSSLQFGEKGKTTLIKEFKEALKNGFIYIYNF